MADNGAVVLARMDSSRFPGKALAPVKGIPLLQRCVEPLLQAGDFKVLIATTSRPVDNPIADEASRLGMPCFRGEADDVALRMLRCAQTYHLDAVARVNGDSPFPNIRLLRQGFAAIETGQYDFCTNLVPRAFPYGVSIEVFRTSFFAECYPKFGTAYHREHVTPYFYEHLHEFRVCCLEYSAGNDHDVRLVVDRPGDVDLIERILDNVDSPATAELPAIVAAYRCMRRVNL